MRAMESHLKELVLCKVETPYIGALIEYSKHVKCYLEIDLEDVYLL